MVSRNCALIMSAILLVVQIAGAIFGTLVYQSREEEAWKAVFLWFMVIADVIPIVIFAKDQMVEAALKYVIILAAAFYSLQLIGQVPILLAVIKESVHAHDCIGDSCYIGIFISNFFIFAYSLQLFTLILSSFLFGSCINNKRKELSLGQAGYQQQN
ncbi:hypothetical protein FGO68_gene6005 [Halteria grandinella]|uniref:Uncharacterized protein n=1 Tax=Halteria grandinella TaxID=5974 RepID=A0A8J8NVB3_HALGN|nr:hypothetical protein FGO68_gene6005 [Halteria grandinella]